MTQVINSILVLSGLAVILNGPAFAADATPASADSTRVINSAITVAPGTTEPAPLRNSSVPSNKPKRRASVSKSILGAITGLIVGTPVCAVRGTIDEDKFAVTDMTGGNKEKKNIVAAAVFWAPFSAAAAVLESPFWALNNSLVHYDKPFSKQQFSLQQRTGSYEKELQTEDKNQTQTQDRNQPPNSGKVPNTEPE